jgi:hypothetical protein
LKQITKPEKLTLSVSVGEAQNSWDIWVYPAVLPSVVNNDKIKVTSAFNASAQSFLKKGGTVLLTLPKGSVKAEKGGNVAVGFSTIFWNTAWTGGQAPHTLGILCDPGHPALKEFPTEFHSDWQWWDAMTHADAIQVSAVSSDLQPIVRVIDDWFTARPLALLFECRIGNGKLLVSGIDLLSDRANRPEARQLLHSLKKYMGSERFNPIVEVSPEKIESLVKE